MQCPQHQRARLCRHHSRAHGRRIADLPDENHVRCLAQGAAQGIGKGKKVPPVLALADEAGIRLVETLQRILQRDDMGSTTVIDRIEKGSERGCLAHARSARHQDKALLGRRKGRECWRRTDFLQCGNPCGQEPECQRRHALLKIRISTETPPRKTPREIQSALFAQRLPLHIAQELYEHIPKPCLLHLPCLVPLQHTVLTQPRYLPCRQVNIRNLFPDSRPDERQPPIVPCILHDSASC